ncbi:NAD-dependent epimerase/dehydratase family protein [Shewanella sp. 1CM18E]|uniref:NAD-dependent epimerase/dehydratase family protein n=1 Tax=Shewanella sp. 1CM18E TaxID=2929169 RepID=UPI0020C0E604|nr:NAD-dependent epimerase/dehydratase family protein [Shewanella sp. 1CM18E]MCK8047037.1 NAD-dependent epimerase/dehydratase family protein [Shewanella sp. 1CM18E]
MNAALIGATGLIGQLLLQKLIDSDCYENILLIGRKQPQYNENSSTKITFIACQLTELSSLELPFCIEHAFCCLGTTIKQAGSQQAFIAVDKTACIDFVDKCQASSNFVVSALGASSQSKTFYNRIKGQTQEALVHLLAQTQHADSPKRLWLFQPSLLLGKRSESRMLEDLAKGAFRFASGLFIGPLQQYRPIEAEQVAAAMLACAISAQDPEYDSIQRVIVISNDEMQQS